MWNIVIACEKYAEKMREKKYSYPLNIQTNKKVYDRYPVTPK